MYPVLFRIGSFEVTSFGVLVAIGALAGLWLLRRELRRSRLPDEAANAATIGLIGGIAGAKLLYVAEHLGEEPLRALLFARAGMSWYGGFIGGVGSAFAVIVHRRWPIIPVLAAATPALALGHLLGRIGCFLVGDDYGRPTDLPWGIAFPEGLPPTSVPVHPTQLYEAAFLGVLTSALLRWRRRGVDDAVVLGRYLLLAGSARFVIEFLRVNVRVFANLSVAHLVSLALVTVGLLLLWRSPGDSRHRPRTASRRPCRT